ncbi:histidinol-phosphate transaminase [Sagittula salina]|uniref:Histidinol-phosphate aminotransferase n=1 Tax=Sagittula salina TaxID=2820268 RepID=A0A940MR34_9RHOB|nr:histidinol-phosphate transaminase [Sagittula salina]MBP0483256.1 histidinol-phosphate transaminase [Sagittula salina]
MAPIEPQPGIMDIAPYVGGKSRVEGVTNVVKLSSNENPFGPSAAAKDAVVRATHEMHRYPSTDHAELRAAIAEVHGLDAERIICGVGSDEIIHFLNQAYAGPETEVLYTEHGFAMYRISALAAGATPVEVRERDRVTCIDTLLAGCTERTRLIFIANPNNPTGTMIGMAEIERLADGMPDNCLLVLDGAYAEYVEGYDGGAKLVEQRDNVVMTRTFSKLYGLGGMRVGWGYAPKPVIDVLNRIRGPFNLSNVALVAAEAAIRDTAYVEKCRDDNTRLRTLLSESLAEHGVPCDTSMANFVLARFADQAEAEGCDLYLQKQGLIVRRVAGYNLPNCLRITVGDEPSVRRVAYCIGQFKAGDR